MKRLLFYLVGVAWMLTGLVSIGYIGAADFEPVLSVALVCYIKSAVWGCVSFALLAVLTNLAWGMDI